MDRRRYRSPVREEAMAATRRRIVSAYLALVAERGGTAATHAETARRAGVATPTAYKHFPTRATLAEAGMQEAMRLAPQVDADAVLETPDVDLRLERLVDIVYGQHAHYAPWRPGIAGEALGSPQRTDDVAANEHRLDELIRDALAPAFGGKVPRPPLAVASALLGFGSWQALTRILRDPDRVRRTATSALRTLVSGHRIDQAAP